MSSDNRKTYKYAQKIIIFNPVFALIFAESFHLCKRIRILRHRDTNFGEVTVY